MIDKLLLKMRARHELSAEEEDALCAALIGPEDIPAQRTVVRRGEPLNRSILLLDGLMCRFKDLRNGRRQITALHIPGDFLDLHGYTLKRLDHDVMAISPCRVAYAPHDRLDILIDRFPHLAKLLWFSTNLDAAIHREWELSLGQRVGATRAANLLCELRTRFELVGMTQDNAFELPMNQTEFGECLGLTVVHTNRVLRELRQRGLVEFAKGHVRILDLGKLEAFAEFDPAYLYTDKAKL